MQPIVTPLEMGEVDRAAPEPVEVLIDRAGAAVARVALQMLGGAYGRRVVVVAGKGNNGADGRSAAARLRRRGVVVHVVEAEGLDAEAGRLVRCDLVIDAAYGTGFRGEHRPPRVGGVPVLAVDIPSGVDGLTGVAHGEPWAATRTVTFAALKPGLLLADGPRLCGVVEVADIGLDVSVASANLVEPADVAAWWPRRASGAHKWRSAVWVVAGSPGMAGAAALCAAGAARAGAGYVRLSTPGVDGHPGGPIEAVGVGLPAEGWAQEVLDDLGRFGAAAVGPGLGRSDVVTTEVQRLVAVAPVPVVVDGDGLNALGDEAADVIRGRAVPTVLTPHDGEFERLAGGRPGADRFAAVRDLARRTGAVVLLKGPLTLVAQPSGEVLAVRAGDQRLATAGTGDVLTGMVAAALSTGHHVWTPVAVHPAPTGRVGPGGDIDLTGPTDGGSGGVDEPVEPDATAGTDPAALTELAEPATLTDVTGVTDVADLANGTDRMDLTDLTDVSDRTDVADLTDGMGLVDMTDLTDLTDGTDLTGGSGAVGMGALARMADLAEAAQAAAAAAFVHGAAACEGPRWGMVAGDLPDLVPQALTGLLDGTR